ncbi:hypothetical protein H7J86_17515 [Mycobacterium hackensackense]|uniref:hypothetical protein n=1 Tax=Mycobacterium hackensackense TaxID=228909 RepID=UPI002265F5C4|nr:hypothetical protein [Mycobacterium hackensackense]MCV7253960.1 hypothetical protein [Mycobacterium hackensackense]
MEHDPSRLEVSTSPPGQRLPVRKRLTRRTKIVLAADLAILIIALAISLAWIALRQEESADRAAGIEATAETTSSTPEPSPPFQSAQGITWITAACGSPTMLDDNRANTLLPQSTDWGICMGTPGALPVLAGVYDQSSKLKDDLAALSPHYHHAVRTDDTGMSWIFVTEGDASTLAGLDRYGFRID